MQSKELGKKIRYNRFDIAWGCLFVGFNFYLIYWLIVIPPAPNIWIGYLFLLISSLYSSLHLKAALIRKDHLKLSKRVVVTQQGNKSIIVKTKTEESLITVDNLNYIDIFYSWNTNPFSSDLQYANLELTNGTRLLIPNLSIETYKLEKIFRSRVRTVRTQFMNKLKSV